MDDPKVHQMTDSELRVFLYLLCLANRQKVRGVIPLDISETAKICRLHVNRIKPAIETFQKLGIIEFKKNNSMIRFINWDKRQFKSDDCYRRVKRYRNKNETFHETLPDTDTDTDTDTEKTYREFEVNYSENFSEFWQAYPKKTGKGYAYQCWQKIKPSKSLTETILSSLESHKKSKQWLKNGGEFIPNPSTWINQRRWEDDPEPKTKSTVKWSFEDDEG